MRGRGNVRVFRSFLSLTAALPLVACSAPRPPQGAAEPPGRASTTAREAETKAEIELIESAPLETSLNHADLRDASEVWPEMIGRAQRTLDVAEFYASEAEGAAAATSRLAPVVAAIESAIKRGVRVRFLADASFVDKYPDTLGRLGRAGAIVRTIDFGARAGGVQHAKYFVVDGVEAFIGSQNFDWRALEHIQEMGARARSAAIAGALRSVFEDDWVWAAGEGAISRPTAGAASRPMLRGPAASEPAPKGALVGPAPKAVAATGETIELVASPQGSLPDGISWDLPALEALLGGAKRSVDLQVLTYSVKNRDGSDFVRLDEALRGAARRGVRVRVLVSHWADKPGGEARRSLEALAREPGVTVRVITIPPWSGGEVPFARVSHAKYLVVDAENAWVGTSNWEGDYFLHSRNVGLVARGGGAARRLAGVFEDGWSAPYTKPLGAKP